VSPETRSRGSGEVEKFGTLNKKACGSLRRGCSMAGTRCETRRGCGRNVYSSDGVGIAADTGQETERGQAGSPVIWRLLAGSGGDLSLRSCWRGHVVTWAWRVGGVMW
jgi:hypothetical protein